MHGYHLVLIFPKDPGGLSLNPPLGLLTLAALTPKEFRVTILDENTEKFKFLHCDLVGISVHTPTADRAYEIAGLYREKGIKVIMGGVHASARPEEAIRHADSVLTGEAETIWAEVLSDFIRGRLRKFYNPGRPSLEMPVIVDWNLINGKQYLHRYMLQTTRGCPRGCDFCAASTFYGKKIRHKPISNVIQEVQNIIRHHNGSKRPFIHMVDDNVGTERKYSKRLFKELSAFDIHWGGGMSVETAQDAELLELAAASGCSWLRLGLESISRETLNKMKKPSEFKQYKDAIRNIRQREIVLQASFVFGYESDSADVFENTLQFCRRENVDFIIFNPLNALPGTQLYQKSVLEGRVIRERFKLEPKNMASYKDLEQKVLCSALSFYSFNSIAERLKMAFKQKGRWCNKYPLSEYLLSSMAIRAAHKKQLSRLENEAKFAAFF
jgi:radical SAM superfamily enzyme YgiQ (UPF0313 family)